MGGRIRVGTSGWSYDHWAGAFYPGDVPRKRWLEHYVERFPTVEINMSFYRLPTATMVRHWHDVAPPRFRFAAKGSRLVTHLRRLDGVAGEVETFVERLSGLKSYLGVVLWQLPPTLTRDVPLLDEFLHALPGGTRHALEFRDPSWLRDDVYALLERRGVASVAVSSQAMPRDLTVTADFVYVRFHGLDGGYAHDYAPAELEPWAEFLREAAGRGREGYVYFNNDARALAPKNALELMQLLGDVALR